MKLYAAFANSSGGFLLFGIKNRTDKDSHMLSTRQRPLSGVRERTRGRPALADHSHRARNERAVAAVKLPHADRVALPILVTTDAPGEGLCLMTSTSPSPRRPSSLVSRGGSSHDCSTKGCFRGLNRDTTG